MTEYKAIQCKNCNRHSMSTAQKPKCTYCGTSRTTTKITNTSYRPVSEYIRQANTPKATTTKQYREE